MKERPILFTGPMVRAILDGSKTQTRRLVPAWQKPSRDPSPDYPDMEWGALAQRDRRYGFAVFGATAEECARELAESACCPHGQPGDRLWVRETWGVVSNDWDADGKLTDWTPDRPATPIAEMRFGQGYYSGHAIYAADGSYEWAGDDDGGGEPRSAWHPSIHMPRAASRILLEIVSVRVERLQDISEADARAEGIDQCDGLGKVEAILDLSKRMGTRATPSALHYATLWESINGAGSWDANPWVWVVEFKRVAP